jgi:hypothetical protein
VAADARSAANYLGAVVINDQAAFTSANQAPFRTDRPGIRPIASNCRCFSCVNRSYPMRVAQVVRARAAAAELRGLGAGMTKPMPCPFCGCDRAVVVDNESGEGGKTGAGGRAFSFVRCLMCDAEGPGERTVVGAVDNWNVRK